MEKVRYTYTFSGGFTVSGEIWNYDEDYNLAVIAVKLKDITSLQLSTIKTVELGESYSIAVGAAVLALGHPNGSAGSMELGMITEATEKGRAAPSSWSPTMADGS